MNRVFYLLCLFAVITVAISFLAAWPLRKNKVLFISIIVFSPLIIAGLYWKWGSMPLLAQYYEKQDKEKQVEEVLAQFKSKDEIIAKMEKAVQQHPEKAKGWYLLGRLYRSQNNNPKAEAAFQKAYQLNSEKFDYVFEYMQVLYLLNNQTRNAEINALIDRLETHWPKHPLLLDFLAMDAYIHHHDEEAIHYWQQLLPYLPEDSSAREAVLLAIGKAEKRLRASQD